MNEYLTSDPTNPALTSSDQATLTIASMLARLFSAISSAGCVPSEWQVAVLVPIYKEKGGANDISNYRPLAMPTATCRLWSKIINNKLMKATETILHDSMFGFRQNLSCLEPIFILRHLADMHRAKRGCIFGSAFMDLSGAYDTVNRKMLFDTVNSSPIIQDSTTPCTGLSRCFTACYRFYTDWSVHSL